MYSWLIAALWRTFGEGTVYYLSILTAPVVSESVCVCVSGVECQTVEYQHHVTETRWEGSSSDIRGHHDECAL